MASTPNTPQFAARVDVSDSYARIEYGVVDLERWKDNDGNSVPGLRFGFDAEVYVSTPGFGREGYTAEVGMGAIGTHSPEDGQLRVRAYSKCCLLAKMINKKLARGASIEAAVEQTLRAYRVVNIATLVEGS